MTTITQTATLAPDGIADSYPSAQRGCGTDLRGFPNGDSPMPILNSLGLPVDDYPTHPGEDEEDAAVTRGRLTTRPDIRVTPFDHYGCSIQPSRFARTDIYSLWVGDDATGDCRGWVHPLGGQFLSSDYQMRPLSIHNTVAEAVNAVVVGQAEGCAAPGRSRMRMEFHELTLPPPVVIEDDPRC